MVWVHSVPRCAKIQNHTHTCGTHSKPYHLFSQQPQVHPNTNLPPPPNSSTTTHPPPLLQPLPLLQLVAASTCSTISFPHSLIVPLPPLLPGPLIWFTIFLPNIFNWCQWGLRGVILVYIPFSLKWMIWVSPGATVWVDSKSGGPITVSHLIRPESPKYSQKAGGLKIWPSPFWIVQLVFRLMFWEDYESGHRIAWIGLGKLLYLK